MSKKEIETIILTVMGAAPLATLHGLAVGKIRKNKTKTRFIANVILWAADTCAAGWLANTASKILMDK